MKLTRRQLRKIIRESFEQRVPLFSDYIKSHKYTVPDGKGGVKLGTTPKIKGNLDPVTQEEIEALRQKGRLDVDLSDLTARQKANLEMLDKSDDSVDVGYARQLYQTFGSTEPGTSPDDEQAFIDAQPDFLKGLQDYNLMQAIEDIIINGNRNPKLLEQLNFVRVRDLDHLNPQSEEYEDDPDLREHFKQLSGLLEKPIEDLVFIDNDSGYDIFYDILDRFLTKDTRLSRGSEYAEYTGSNIFIFSVGNKNVALLDHMMGGLAIITI